MGVPSWGFAAKYVSVYFSVLISTSNKLRPNINPTNRIAMRRCANPLPNPLPTRFPSSNFAAGYVFIYFSVLISSSDKLRSNFNPTNRITRTEKRRKGTDDTQQHRDRAKRVRCSELNPPDTLIIVERYVSRKPRKSRSEIFNYLKETGWM